jgi:hypothetical protein
VHARVTRYQPTPQEKTARAKEALAERIETQIRIRTLDAIRKKLPAILSRPDLEMAALDYFQRLGHDNHRRLFRVYGWEEKKTKASWGGTTVDYQTIAAKAIREMKPQDAQHFLVVCALVSDICCRGYNSRQPLAKDSNLARTAARYKVDTIKLVATVRTEHSKPNEKLTGKNGRTKTPTQTKSK